ncbi:MAG: polysaccharide deacetylase family protein [Longimicrobiales bacterium]
MRAILCYHSIDASGSVISVDPDVFRQQIAWLERSAVRVVPLDRLVESHDSGDAVALTFDDAFANFAETAWPVLRDAGLPATVFAPTDHMGGWNDWVQPAHLRIPALPLMSWQVLARLTEEGVVVGSHTCTHPDLTTLPAAAIAGELEHSADRIERETGRRPGALAYPFGACDARVADVVASRYRHACTTRLEPYHAADSRHELPRLDMYYFRRAGQLERWGSWRFDATLRARRTARSARHVLLPGRSP